MPTRTRKPTPPPKHSFYADGDIPADHKDNRRCHRCGVMGKPGDSRHTDEHPPTPDGDRSKQILGENS